LLDHPPGFDLKKELQSLLRDIPKWARNRYDSFTHIGTQQDSEEFFRILFEIWEENGVWEPPLPSFLLLIVLILPAIFFNSFPTQFGFKESFIYQCKSTFEGKPCSATASVLADTSCLNLPLENTTNIETLISMFLSGVPIGRFVTVGICFDFSLFPLGLTLSHLQGHAIHVAQKWAPNHKKSPLRLQF
jgi:hypothetical protein